MADLTVNIAGVEFKNPVITASAPSASAGNTASFIR